MGDGVNMGEKMWMFFDGRWGLRVGLGGGFIGGMEGDF